MASPENSQNKLMVTTHTKERMCPPIIITIIKRYMLCFHPRKRIDLDFLNKNRRVWWLVLENTIVPIFPYRPKHKHTIYLSNKNECTVEVPPYSKTEGGDHVTHKEAPNTGLTNSTHKIIKKVMFRTLTRGDVCNSPIFARFILLFIYVRLYVLICD